jgi:hypothetical protein
MGWAHFRSPDNQVELTERAGTDLIVVAPDPAGPGPEVRTRARGDGTLAAPAAGAF